MGGGTDFGVGLGRSSDDVTVVEACGELDFYTSSEFRQCLMCAVEGGAPRVLVDLARVTFIDSSALGVLVGAARLSAQCAIELMIVCPAGSVARVIAISGLSRGFAMYATREEALGEGPQAAT